MSGASEAFVITTQMVSATIPDQLPHVNVFVIAVPDVLDPKQDALTRVAMLADLSVLPIGRDPGIAAPGPNGIEYLASATTNSYPDLQTAQDAATALQDRVNALIEAWISFRTTFNAPDPTPALYTLPRVNPSQKTALINAYTVAKQTRYQAQINKVNADGALTRAQTDYTFKQNLLAGIASILPEAALTQTNLTLIVTQFGTLLTAANVFYAANTMGTGAAAFLTSITTATSQQAAMTGFIAAASQLVTDVTNYNSARVSDATAANTTLTAAKSDQITKAQTLTSTLAIESAALAAVLAVCPDFDKHSIPFVPDTEP